MKSYVGEDINYYTQKNNNTMCMETILQDHFLCLILIWAEIWLEYSMGWCRIYCDLRLEWTRATNRVFSMYSSHIVMR